MCEQCNHDHEILKAGKKSFLGDTTSHDLKYIQDLQDEYTYYVSQLILNIYNGVAANLGIKNPDMLAARSPRELRLEKGFLSGMTGIGRKIRGYIGRKIKKSPYEAFEIKGLNLFRKDKPMTNADWLVFERQVINYMRPYLEGLGEEMAVKGMLLAMASNEMEQQGKGSIQYGKKSYEQIEKEMFGGYVPDTIIGAEERFNIEEEVSRATGIAYVKAADFLQDTSKEVQGAVKEQVIRAHRLGNSPTELASDLYWMKEDIPEIKEYTAEINMRDFRRVANTELAMIHERGKIAQYEVQARKSVDKEADPVYFTFQGGGVCDWCKPRQGDIARLIPMDLVGNERDDTLSSRGIKDPHTDICVWQGKNNIGYKKAEWRLATPAHPFCADTFSRIYPDIQKYDKATGRIKYIAGKEFVKFIPQDFMDELEGEKAKYRERQDILAKKRAESLLREGKQKI